jgi:hypothetical protein
LNSFVNDIFERICKLKQISADSEAGTSWYQYLQKGDGDLELLHLRAHLKLKRISAEAGTSWYRYLQQGNGDLELLRQWHLRERIATFEASSALFFFSTR